MAEKKSKNLLVAFVGPSCAGKSTCYEYALPELVRLGYLAFRCDVAIPLRCIQQFAYRQFGLASPGYADVPTEFKQDGKLLAFLAKHFEERLGPRLAFEVEAIQTQNHQELVAIINTDCRNNAYESLKKLGFVFVWVGASPNNLEKRRTERGDLTPFNPEATVEQTGHIHPRHYIFNNGTKEGLGDLVREIIRRIIQAGAL